jgi:integrase
VPLPLTVVDSVAAHLAEFDTGVLGTVFSTEGGEPLRRNRFSERVWRPAVAKARLRPGTRFHELRHYYASLLKLGTVALAASFDIVEYRGNTNDQGFCTAV